MYRNQKTPVIYAVFMLNRNFMRILFVNIFWYAALVYKTVRENYDLCGLALKLFLALAIIVYEIVFVYL